MEVDSNNILHLKGKYCNDLMECGEHAINGQNQSEKRINIEYSPKYERFVNSDISFDKQYNSFYNMRLKEMRPILETAAKEKWGNDIELLQEIRNVNPNVDCVIIGTIYKDLSLFKSILNEKSSSSFDPQLIGTQFLPKSSIHGPLSQNGDPIILEDMTTRILLKNFTDPIVTGVVPAIRGSMDDNGDFVVQSVCYAYDSVTEQSTAPPAESEIKDSYVLCASGLSVGCSITLRSNMLMEFIAGQIGFIEDVKQSAHIGHVVFVGNSTNLRRDPFQRIRQVSKDLDDTMKCVDNFDLLLSQILPTVPVTVIPGSLDAVSLLVPQQPLHPSLFPRCIPFSSFECATNPYEAVFNGHSMMMTSGQNVADIARQISPELSAIEIMTLTLRWGALFPTDPNTCPGYPYDTFDPFVIKQLPDIYLTGNQKSLELKRLHISGKDIVMISLPSFATSGTVIMINTRSLEIVPIHLDAESIEEGGMEIEVEKVEEDVIINEDIQNEEE